MNKTILKINDLSKNYHTRKSEIKAISNISFNVYEREILAIVGPSGCGKSTLLSCLANLEDISHGQIEIKDHAKIGYMLQTDSLFPWLTIRDNILIGLDVKKIKTKENIENALNLLKKYGLEDFKDSYPNNLSGGMRQRVG